jgi:hypothetical protein
VGVGAWAAVSFFATGAQPAEALPADTLGYVSIDLDPSGGQKIEALRTLNKFPAFEDEVGIDTDDDIRKAIFDKIQDEADCDGLDFQDDIEPWLGDRAAVAAVDNGGDAPLPVVVVQVKDAAKAEDGLAAIKKCGGGGDEGGWVVEGDWAVITESEDAAQDVVAAAKDGTLADDDTFKRWTDEAGDSGVMTMYAGPAAGDYFAEHADELGGTPFGGLVGEHYVCEGSLPSTDEVCPDVPSSVTVPDGLKDKLRAFKGIAATVRFDDGAIELETAGDASVVGQGLLSSGATADVVGSLPTDTIAAFGLGFEDDWFAQAVDTFAPYTGKSADDLLAELSEATGLDLPDDAETLAGDSAVLSLGHGFDPESFFESPDGSDMPVAVKIKGDPDRIETVLDKLRELAGPESGILDTDSDGDTIVLGPDADYRAEVLEDGGLGDDDVYQDVVREADDASTVLFVNVNEIEKVIAELSGDSDDEFLDNLEPVSGIGVTGWVDDDVAHAVFRLATD